MSVVAGLAAVLRQVRQAPEWKTDDYAQSLFDSPVGSPGTNVDDSDVEGTTPTTSDATNVSSGPRTKVVMYETPAADAGSFAREEIQTTAKASGLKSELAALKAETAERRSSPAPSTAPGAMFTIFVQGSAGKPMKIGLPSDVSMGAAVGRVLEMYRTEGRTPVLENDPTVYLLRIAEDDGSPDTDLPVPDRSLALAKFGKVFVLCPVPARARGDSVLAIPRSASGGTSPSPTFRARSRSDVPTVIDLEAVGRPGVLESNSLRGNFFVQLLLPQNATAMMHAPPDMLVRDLLAIFAARRGINPEQYAVRLPTSETQLPRDVTVLGVGADQLVVVPLPSALPHDFSAPLDVSQPSEADQQPLILSELAAGAYREFPVIKTNKYGVQQERIMGIDHDYVHNKLPSRQQSGFLGGRKTKKESRAIADITRLAPMQDKPNALVIEWKDGSERIAYTYQCRTKQDAGEILARLKFLMAVARSRTGSEKS
eukprot:TRINITY_DN4655_c0_g1_i1.p1 TRINITY_DN4655_c0_g1~~TRINITY_DN4655_c0_g1_i1.p1  ORF type:complete len:506 (-),score=86.49 TRINITY_DN4655_c0_g1_i1:10-1461(-)